VAHLGPNNQFNLIFRPVPPQVADTAAVQTEIEEMLRRQIHVSTGDWLTGETFEWTVSREAIASWLRISQIEGYGPAVTVDEDAVRASVETLAAGLGAGRGLDLEEATTQVVRAFDAGGGDVALRLHHAPRAYEVQAGDDLTRIAARFGMPPGLIAEVNPDINLNWLRVGQTLVIPSEDALRPYPPVPGKEIVISVAEQRMRVYENGALIHEWPVSTGVASSPTYTGHFQVLSKNENAYASQWDLWMPHFIAIYRAGGDTYNGIHALPILSSGQRLWEGALGSPASYGCVILGTAEAATLYNWADVGVSVIVE
jgi:lipoprotein-anchoring transpeptidase ErfK/SrfK